MMKQRGESSSHRISRRRLMRVAAAAAGAALFDPDPVLARLIDLQQPCAAEGPLRRLLATLPLNRPGGVVQPFGVKFGGAGLDARLISDLSRLDPQRLLTPTADAYVRTECPAIVRAHRGPWRITVSGLLAQAGKVTLDGLMRDARPMGAHLFECSGNNNPANFGLMSVAEWDGVPIADVVATLRPSASATAVLVRGMDPDAPSSMSVAGASWVFPLASLERLGAFLAVRMNGATLPLDHGWPVRLAVPSWYGCAWIKWVEEIRLVDDTEPATSQMKEFAGRTHQTAAHALARDYAPPAIETAATPVRVEQRLGPDGLEYRIVGIVWGGTRPVTRLAIRFNEEQWESFDLCPVPANSATWSLWTYRWKPPAPGVYRIALRVPDTSVPQRRLDSGYYVRHVVIDRV